MRLDKIYTKIGDKGKTMLASGKKIDKFDLRIDTYGTVDELNSTVGLMRDFLAESEESASKFKDSIQQIEIIQNELFDIGGELATPEEVLDIEKQQVVRQSAVTRLENEIDNMNENLPPLTNFILPGGHKYISQTHIARCVCRRAERLVCKLSKSESIRPEVQIYLNRLSDWFFVTSRSIASKLQVKEILWQQNKK